MTCMEGGGTTDGLVAFVTVDFLAIFFVGVTLTLTFDLAGLARGAGVYVSPPKNSWFAVMRIISW